MILTVKGYVVYQMYITDEYPNLLNVYIVLNSLLLEMSLQKHSLLHILGCFPKDGFIEVELLILIT